MGCYWVNFAASGDPNKGPSGCSARLKLPAWPKLGADGVRCPAPRPALPSLARALSGWARERARARAHMHVWGQLKPYPAVKPS